MKITKPMLAGKCTDAKNLQYPVLATPKLDGIRCLVIDGKAVSRKFKAIPNDYIRQTIELTCNSMQLDGEIIIPGRNFNDLSGDVRRKDGRPTNFEYHVFDLVDKELDGSDPRQQYAQRMRNLAATILSPVCKKVLPTIIADAAALAEYEEAQLALGYEGVMVRSQRSPYKCGRSTENEGYLLKIKRFEDEEAQVFDFEEEMENQNVATRDAFGRTERSAHKENMRPKGTLGKLICGSDNWVKTFGIGTGYTAEQRYKIWQMRDKLVGKTVKFKHQLGPEKTERPRFPVFLGFRDDWDM